MIEWQPIETAPRDGTVMLLYFPEFAAGLPSAAVGKGRWDSEQGRFQGDDFTDGSRVAATHWMPLPPPPKE